MPVFPVQTRPILHPHVTTCLSFCHWRSCRALCMCMCLYVAQVIDLWPKSSQAHPPHDASTRCYSTTKWRRALLCTDWIMPSVIHRWFDKRRRSWHSPSIKEHQVDHFSFIWTSGWPDVSNSSREISKSSSVLRHWGFLHLPPAGSHDERLVLPGHGGGRHLLRLRHQKRGAEQSVGPC